MIYQKSHKIFGVEQYLFTFEDSIQQSQCVKNVKYTNSHCSACAEGIYIVLVSIPISSGSAFHMNMFC